MLRLTLFILILTTIGWTWMWALSGRNQRRTVLSIGKVLAVLGVVLLVASILLSL